MRTRAERRHHNKRVKDNFSKVINESWGSMSDDWKDWWVPRNFNNRKNCSCLMCGNPRKTFKQKTLKEIQSEEELTRDRLTAG